MTEEEYRNERKTRWLASYCRIKIVKVEKISLTLDGEEPRSLVQECRSGDIALCQKNR